ncbi:MAG: GLUG motif-containing protein [Desulfitobacterium sp.]
MESGGKGMLIKRIKKKITAMLLSVIMVLGMMPVSVVAEAGSLPIGTSGEITAFEALGLDIAAQSVPLGTSKADLELPNTLTATIRLAASGETDDIKTGGSEADEISSPFDAEDAMDSSEAVPVEESGAGAEQLIVPLPVTWVSSPEYDCETAAEYIFTPELPKEIILASGVDTPTITVMVNAAVITGAVTTFGALPDNIRWQNTTTPEFPETVDGIVGGEAVQILVTWQTEQDYNEDFPERGLYVFTAVLGEGYGVADGVEPPLMTVYIPQTIGRMMARMSGGGTTDSPLEITTAAQLAEIAVLVNARPNGLELFLFNSAGAKVSLKLMNEIDLSSYTKGEGWVPIGHLDNYFKGTFDGGGHQITGLTINYTSYNNAAGLFGCVDGGTVKNLGVADADINGGNFVGGVAGSVDQGTVENCFVTGSVSGDYTVGGVAGSVNQGTVENYFVTGSVSGDLIVGGVVGSVDQGTVENCYVTGSVSGIELVGGVAGAVESGSTVQNSYSTGSVIGSDSGSDSVGGVAGAVTNGGTMQNCAALNPSVTGTNNVGCVVGVASGGTLDGNIAFGGMTVTADGSPKTISSNAAGVDGATKTATDIRAAVFFETLFENDTAWTYENGKLPGFGASVDMPPHLAGGGSPFFHGTGAEADPYQITTPAQLSRLAELVNASATNAQYGGTGVYYQLTVDISLSDYASGEGWVPIGISTMTFKGHFDGGNHKITGLTINRPSVNYQGLFGHITGGTVENLGVVGTNITGGIFTGGVAGYVTSGRVENC